MENPIAVTVEILGKEYRIACAEDEKDALLASARYLDEKMSDVKGDGKVVGSERRGKIEISYFSAEDLSRIYDWIMRH